MDQSPSPEIRRHLRVDGLQQPDRLPGVDGGFLVRIMKAGDPQKPGPVLECRAGVESLVRGNEKLRHVGWQDGPRPTGGPCQSP